MPDYLGFSPGDWHANLRRSPSGTGWRFLLESVPSVRKTRADPCMKDRLCPGTTQNAVWALRNCWQKSKGYRGVCGGSTMSRSCRDCKHCRPDDSGLTGRCLHPRFGGHPAVRGGLKVFANDLMCAQAGLDLWERRPRQVQFAHRILSSLLGSHT